MKNDPIKNKYKINSIRKTLKLYGLSEEDITDFVQELNNKRNKLKEVEEDNKDANKD